MGHHRPCRRQQGDRRRSQPVETTPDLDEAHLWLAALGLGYLRNLGPFGGLLPGVGVMGQLEELPARAEPFYGTSWPVIGLAYLRLAVAPR